MSHYEGKTLVPLKGAPTLMFSGRTDLLDESNCVQELVWSLGRKQQIRSFYRDVSAVAEKSFDYDFPEGEEPEAPAEEEFTKTKTKGKKKNRKRRGSDFNFTVR